MFEELRQLGSRGGGERRGKLARTEARWGYAFIGLWLVGFSVFLSRIPMVASFVFSLYDFQLANPDAGALRRPGELATPAVRRSAGVAVAARDLYLCPYLTAYRDALGVLFGGAAQLETPRRRSSMFRTLFYAPIMVPAVATVLIWSGVLNPTTGWLNRFIETFTGVQASGPNGIRWLDDPALVYIAYTMIGLWGIGNAILYNLASLQGVPDRTLRSVPYRRG